MLPLYLGLNFKPRKLYVFRENRDWDGTVRK